MSPSKDRPENPEENLPPPDECTGNSDRPCPICGEDVDGQLPSHIREKHSQ